MNKRDLVKGYVLVILSTFLFGCMPLITTYIYAQGVNPESVVLLRNLISLPVLALLAYRQSGSLRVPIKSVPVIALMSLTGCCLTPLMLYASYQYIATGTATVFHFVYPATVVLFGLVFLHKKTSAGALLSVALCVGGICLFYNPAEPLNWIGCSLALVSGMIYAVYVVLLSTFRYPEVNGFKLSFYVAVVCSAFLMAVCLIGDRLTLPVSITGWLLCALFAMLISVGAVVMFQQGTFLIGGVRASILSTVEPLTGVVIGVLAFHERITLGMGIGSVLVIVACILNAVVDAKETAAPATE